MSATIFNLQQAENLAGATIEKQGIVATFSLASLKEGLAFYLVYEGTRCPCSVSFSSATIAAILRK